MDDQKQNGVVFTPQWIAKFMIDELFKNREISGDEKILDTGCGDGIFSILIAKKFSKLAKKPIEKVVSENIFFIDISGEHIDRTKQNLQKLCDHKISNFNAINADFCFHRFGAQFNFVIGNPPYVRIQNLEARRENLQNRFLSAENGSIDLYFCFFERSLELLTSDGEMAFITPNSHFHSRAGKNLRKILSPHLTKIINFDHHQVFQNATAYTAISFLKKQNSEICEFSENFKDDFSKLEFRKIETKNLRSEKWEFFDENFSTEFRKLRRNHATLGEIADIHCGIATLKDDLYIFSPTHEDRKYFYRDQFKLEKDLCVPIIKASTFKGEAQNLKLIFPYENEKLISEAIFRERFPEAFRYFSAHREILENRNKGDGKNYKEFYAFGRTQALRTSFGKKVITSTMNKKPHFFVVEDRKTSFFSGYCVKPKNDNLTLYELCEILNSEAMERFINAVSSSYRCGYKSYAKKFIKDFVHPKFDRTQQALF